jgi:ERCC4-related helicase
MLIDNHKEFLYKFLKDRIFNKTNDKGEFYFVSGFFSLKGLSFLADLSSKLEKIQCILGEVNEEDGFEAIRFIDLINDALSLENLDKSIEEKEKIKSLLKNPNFEIKTLEPNFCHAKMYLYESKKDHALSFYVTGSANLTTAGLGLKKTSNVEMSIAKTGIDNEFNDLKEWFVNLWKSNKAHIDKQIKEENDIKRIPYKEYILQLLDNILKPYTPEDIYYKILFEFFSKEIFEDEQQKQKLKRLEETIIFKSLYEFQKVAVKSLISKLEKFNGAILADAVGLGKTWTALAVAKYYQMQGREIIILCPKRLMDYWRQFHKNFDTKFKKDELEFFVRSHSDLEDLERLKRYNDRSDLLFKNDRPKLFIVDESHNFRNDNTEKYQNLISILKDNPDCKVLLLTATPINNSFKDLRNQVYIIAKKEDNAFKEVFPNFNIYYGFINAQKKLEEYMEQKITLKEFLTQLDINFKQFLDSILIARNRKILSTIENRFSFPEKINKNIYIEVPIVEKDFKKLIHLTNQNEMAESLINLFSSFTAYRPSFFKYLSKNISVLEDPRIRESALVGIMVTLIIKRLESSWYSFYETITRIKKYFKEVQEKVEFYIKKNYSINNDIKLDLKSQIEELNSEEDELTSNEFYIGKQNQVSLKEMDKFGNITAFNESLEKDIKILENLIKKIEEYKFKLKNSTIKDKKLEELKKILKDIINKKEKVIIFTTYHDTAIYLFEELKKEFTNIAVITGSIQKTDEETNIVRQEILERFTPFTKLFLEKEENYQMDVRKSFWENYQDWKKWISKENKKDIIEKLENPINILIATDVLSEGQNLQEARYIINYDIHWNPVRLIQRIGRIDRVGSPYKEIYIYNFWPTDSIEEYLNLKQRITNKFLMMLLTKTEIEAIDEEIKNRLSEMDTLLEEDKKLYEQFKEEHLYQDYEWESGENKLGFDDFSYDIYREELRKKYEFYKNKPNGMFSGIKDPDLSMLSNNKFDKGLIAVLGIKNPSNTKKIEYTEKLLIFLDNSSKEIIPIDLNAKLPPLEILNFLKENYKKNTYLPFLENQNADSKDLKEFLEQLKKIILEWLKQKFSYNKEQIEAEKVDILISAASGGKNIKKSKDHKLEEIYNPNNIDLICWMYIDNKH